MSDEVRARIEQEGHSVSDIEADGRVTITIDVPPEIELEIDNPDPQTTP